MSKRQIPPLHPRPADQILQVKHSLRMGFVTDQRDLIFLKPVTEQYLKNLQGSLKSKGGLKTLVDERRKDRERESKYGG